MKPGTLKKTGAFVVISGLALFFLIEGAVRMAGMMDFPLYRIDVDCAYIPAPDQQGAFLNRNRWRYNSLSMGAGSYEPNRKSDLLLLGDSIVMGGNRFDFPETLGARIEQSLGTNNWSVWPVGAGSWAVGNAMAYVDKHPELLADMESVVWVVNTGDFGQKSQWQSNRFQPLSRPLIASWYLFDKYIWWPRIEPKLPFPKEVPKPLTHDAMPEMADWLRAKSAAYDGCRWWIVFYPNQVEQTHQQSEPWTWMKARLREMEGERIRLLDVNECATWNGSEYFDGIHPTAEGNRLLGEWIANEVKR